MVQPTCINSRYASRVGLQSNIRGAHLSDLILIVILALFFLSGCAGSPRIMVDKSIHICNNTGAVTVDYKTASDLDTKTEVEQDLKGDLKATLK